MVYRRALRGALWSPLQSDLERELRAPSPNAHGEQLSRVVQLRGALLLHHDDEQRGNDVLVLSCDVRQLSSTFCVCSVHFETISETTPHLYRFGDNQIHLPTCPRQQHCPSS